MNEICDDIEFFYDHIERLKNNDHWFKINLLTKLDSVIK